MLLNTYIVYYNVDFVEKNPTGYFIEKFLCFSQRKKNNSIVFNRFIIYNSNRSNYFFALFQYFLKVKLEKINHFKNLVSRINLLKQRFEFPRFDSLQLFMLDKIIFKAEKKMYGSFNVLPIIPKKSCEFSLEKLKFIFKKFFFAKGYKLILVSWYWCFKKLFKVIQLICLKFSILIKKYQINLIKIPDKTLINKLITNSKNNSWISGIINLLNHSRKFYQKKNTAIYVRSGLLRLSNYSFSGFLIINDPKKIKIKNKFSKFKTSFSFSMEPISGQFNRIFNFFTPNLHLRGIYGFRILASKKKLPLKLYTTFSPYLDIYNLIPKKPIQKFCVNKFFSNFIINQDHRIYNQHPVSFFQNKSLGKPRILDEKNRYFNQLIIKEAGDFHNEIGAFFLLSQFEKILREYQIDIWLNPLSFNSYCHNGGSIEVIVNSNSFHEIKSNNTLEYFIYNSEKNKNIKTKKKLIQNFLESLAGYSLFCYLLQLKDRHNANILINKDNRIIHVDFAFILGYLPGNLNLEASSFKMSEDFVFLLKGKKTQSFDNLREIFTRGFLILRKNLGKVVKIAKFFILEAHSKNRNKSKLLEFIKRFGLKFKSVNSIRYCHRLFKDSLEDWRTIQYDKYQMLASGIKI